MVNATNTSFDERPEPLNRVRMDFPVYINLLGMVDPPMRVTACPNAVVRAECVGKDRRVRQNVLFNESPKRIGFHIGSDKSADLALALDHAHDRSFLGSASACAFASAPVVGLIHFDLATEAANWTATFVGQHRPNLLKHPPRGFVGHARLALNLFRANSATSGSHQVHGIE